MGKQKLDLEMLSIVRDFIKSSGGQKFICGTYSNGKPRSVVDALRNPYQQTKFGSFSAHYSC